MTDLLFVLGATFLMFIGIFYPTVVVALFLFVNLLFPKLPLIQIQGYMVPIRIEDVFLACGLLSLLLRCLIYKEKPARNPLQRWMVIFSVVTGISFLFGLFVLNSVPGAKIGFLFWLRAPEYFATSYLCLLGVTKWKQYRQMMVALGVFVSLVGVYGLLQEYSLVPIFNAMHMTDEIVVIQFSPGFGEDRLFSTFAGPYDLSAFYLLAIPIFTALFVLAVSRVARLALAGLLALSFICFYLTYARAPLGAMVLALAVSLWSLGKRTWGLVLGPLCFFLALLFGGFVERLSYAADDPLGDYSVGGRIVGGWADALSAVSRSPLLGTGPASLGEGMGADGMYFMLLGMWGLVGLVCFLVLIGKAIHCQWQCIRTSRDRMQRALAIGLFAGTLGLLVNAITVDSFFISKVAFSYWFLMGLLMAGRSLGSQAQARKAAARAPAGLPKPQAVPPSVPFTTPAV